MEWFVYIAWLLILSQAFFSLMVFNNYRYALEKYNSNKRRYKPRVALIIPCKNIDTNFEQNISSFYRQDYDDYLLWFVVGDSRDPAYDKLCKIKERLAGQTKAKDVQVLISGAGQACSQKIHNLLYASQKIPGDVEALAFADSDIFVKPAWLGRLVQRLRLEKTGATTGYRWYVPEKNNFATLALVAINAKIAQLMGNTIFNQAWGGSMAIRVKMFRELGLDKIWQKAVSDDLSLGCAVKGAGRKVEFVPGCLVATRESTTWAKLFEFGRRQFIITKVAAPKTWLLGLFSSVYSLAGLWGMAALSIYAAVNSKPHVRLFVAVATIFLIMQFARAILRQSMACKLFAEDWSNLRVAAIVDIAFFWLWSWLMLILILSSIFGRTITWCGIRYKLLGPTETIVLKS
ncbi:MAG: glycosyltransferase family 2 protein [Sedimentisphaerales bacterium]|nr:glycosyltransferase family 2 protein [Sedimentisphaerales bacterium]